MFNFFNKTSNSAIKFYFGLILREDDGVGMILKIDETNHSISILDESKFNYSNSWERIVEDVDQVISRLENQNNLKVKQVIYFVYSHMVSQSDKQIKPIYLNKIKKIAKELELKPLGYIAYHEALVNYFRRIEESPLTSTIIELDKNSISIFIYKGGVVTYSNEIASTELSNLVGDLEVAFTKASSGNKAFLPSRMILYDSHNIEKESTKIITHHWNENLFIQIPRVEVITMDKIKEALINCFSDQLFEITSAKNEIVNNDSYQEEDFEEDVEPEKPKNIDDFQKVEILDDEKMDFVEDPTSLKLRGAGPSIVEGLVPDVVEGFSIGKDIRDSSQISNIKSSHFVNTSRDKQISNIENQKSDYVSSRIADEDFRNNDNNFLKPENGFEKMFSFVKSIFSKFSIGSIGMKNIGVVAPAIVGIVLILSAVFIYLYFFHRADVIVNFNSQKIEKEIDVSNLNFQSVDKEITKTVEMVTTGKKTIGESAKGTVLISSLFSSEKILKKGTVLSTVTSNIKFLLNEEIKIPSRSGSMLDGNVSPGKVRADVTGFEIGPNGNIEKGQKMKVEEYSTDDVVAVSENNFTGGIKKDIQTASLDDYARLRKEAENQINIDASDSAKTDLNGSKIVPELTSIDVVSEKFSKELNTEATSISLTEVSNVKYMTYKDLDIKKIISDSISKDVPLGFELKNENISYQFIEATDNNGEIKATIKVNIKLMQKIDRSKLLNDLVFKNINEVETMVKKNYNAVSLSVKPLSEISFINNYLPLFSKNINLRIESK
jgi:hypothetical protein